MKKQVFQSIDEYISTFPEDVQVKLEKVRLTIQNRAPGAVETISYGMPTFNLNGSYLIYFAGWKNHISIYPAPSIDKIVQNKLSPYLSGKGTVKFPLAKPIPYDLIEKTVEYQLREHQKKEKQHIRNG